MESLHFAFFGLYLYYSEASVKLAYLLILVLGRVNIGDETKRQRLEPCTTFCALTLASEE